MRPVHVREKEKEALEEEDRIILESMDHVAGYLDITPEDFLDILHHARASGLNEKNGHPGKQAAGDYSRTGVVSGATIETTVSGTATAPSIPAPEAEQKSAMGTVADWMHVYIDKIVSPSSVAPRIQGWKEVGWSWLGSFLGIQGVAYLHFVILTPLDSAMLIGSFGASAVLIYGAIRSPLAQPRNLVGGHVLSALVGAGLYMLMPEPIWLTSALAVSLSIALMHRTGTLHPPGGATALIAVIGSDQIHSLGLWYAIVPVGVGAMIMLLVAVLVNNVAAQRKYPEYWW